MVKLLSIAICFAFIGCAEAKEEQPKKVNPTRDVLEAEASKLCLKHDGPGHVNKHRVICNDGSRFKIQLKES